MSSSSNLVCAEAYYIYTVSAPTTAIAILLGIVAFSMYAIRLHRNPTARIIQNKYDIESASWVLILVNLAALTSGGAAIVNYHCGEKCPTATLQCNTQIATATSALISAIGAVSAGVMKFLSIREQTKIAYKALTDID